MLNNRPVIGVSVPLTEASRDYRTSHFYEDAIAAAGGIAIMIPAANDPDAVEAILSVVDGVIVPGGADIDPSLYGEEPKRGLGLVKISNDIYEIGFLRAARRKQKPILCICRGFQVLNVAFGGSLYQDLPTEMPEGIQHWQAPVDRRDPYHSMDIKEGSYLFDAYGQKTIRVNSFHHQGVKTVAPGFTVSARARDGLVEAIEVKEEHILGIQWHPEEMYYVLPEHHSVFVQLVNACRK